MMQFDRLPNVIARAIIFVTQSPLLLDGVVVELALSRPQIESRVALLVKKWSPSHAL